MADTLRRTALTSNYIPQLSPFSISPPDTMSSVLHGLTSRFSDSPWAPLLSPTMPSLSSCQISSLTQWATPLLSHSRSISSPQSQQAHTSTTQPSPQICSVRSIALPVSEKVSTQAQAKGSAAFSKNSIGTYSPVYIAASEAP